MSQDGASAAEGEGSGRERRTDPRIDQVSLVQVSRFDEDGFRADLATGRTLNISRGGLRLELFHPLPLRSVVRLNLAVGDDIVEVDGVVTYLEVLDEDRCAMGIQFRDPDAKVRETLEALLT